MTTDSVIKMIELENIKHVINYDMSRQVKFFPRNNCRLMGISLEYLGQAKMKKKGTQQLLLTKERIIVRLWT